jgi:hypothetical protein
MLLRALLGAVIALGLWPALAGPAAAQPVQPTTSSPPVTTAPPATTAPPTTVTPPTTAAPLTTARPPTTSSRPATTRPATTAARRQVRGEASSSLPAAPAATAPPGPGRATGPARPAGGSTIVDPTLPPAQVGQVPEVAVRPVGEGRPGQAQLQWAGGLVRRAWQLAPMGLMGLVSWTVWLVRRLLSVRYQPAYDPVAGDQAVDPLPEMKLAPEPLDAVEGAHALVVMTGWPELAELDPVVARERMAYPIGE